MSGKTAITFCRSLDEIQLFLQGSTFKNCNELNHKHLNDIEKIKTICKKPCIDKFPMRECNSFVSVPLFFLEGNKQPWGIHQPHLPHNTLTVKPPQMRHMPWASTPHQPSSDRGSKLLCTWGLTLITHHWPQPHIHHTLDSLTQTSC